MSAIDYESRENCFQKCSHIKSRLVCGDVSDIPMPWITVLVPTYKRVGMLEEALNSVLAQQHVDFFWDIIVLDNETDDGKENDTERLIRSIDNRRILYYRNSEHMRPGDNFNRGFLLARGEWVMMLHDDDILILNTLQTIGDLVRCYPNKKKPLGAIAAAYIQVEYSTLNKEMKTDIEGMNQYLCDHPSKYNRLYHLTHTNVKVLGHIGGSVPSNGSTFRRKAVIDAGGFNEDYGISGDLILLYNLENQYNVYQTIAPLGFYRWGDNTMTKPESTYQVIRNGYEFREYVYAKSWRNRIVGKLFRNCHYRKFTTDVIMERKRVSNEQRVLSDFDDIYSGRPNPVWYLFYKCIISRVYGLYKRMQSKVLAQGMRHRAENI